jgi:hypothetical protein
MKSGEVCGEYSGHLYYFVTGIYTFKIFDNCVENLVNRQLLTAIFALFSNILNA